MDPTVETIWWVSLGLALLLTLLAAARLARVVRTCGQILQLARRTVPSAQGIADHTSSIKNLGAVLTLAPVLLSVAGKIDSTAETIAGTLESVAPEEA